MARRRFVFTENGVPLAKPREVILPDKPPVPEILRIASNQPPTSLQPQTGLEPSGNSHWVDFEEVGE